MKRACTENQSLFHDVNRLFMLPELEESIAIKCPRFADLKSQKSPGSSENLPVADSGMVQPILSYLHFAPFPLVSFSPSSLIKTPTIPLPISLPSSKPGLIATAIYFPSPEKAKAATLAGNRCH